MHEWNVYVNGRYVGTVHELTETLARCAALSKFDIDEDDAVSVTLRR